MSGASVVAPPTETRGTGGYRREAAAAALFLAVSLVIRASSFFQSAIDWDESL